MSDSYYELIDDLPIRDGREVPGDRSGPRHLVGLDTARRTGVGAAGAGAGAVPGSATTPG